MRILIPGGCGYLGAWLIPFLLADGHRVTVLDSQLFGNGHLPDNDHLDVVKGDVRNKEILREVYPGQDVVLYLASISNNDLCVKYPKVAKEVNEDALVWNLSASRNSGVHRFIYASSVAGYGHSDEPSTETDLMEPTTPYAKSKAFCERKVLAQSSYDFTVTVVRSASVCGYSPRQRFDLTVNKMTHDAIRHKRIKVNGGDQKRSHIHIKDISDFYCLLVKAPRRKINGEVFNVVAENQSVSETASLVAQATGAGIQTGPSTDTRSYSVDGSKAQKTLGFTPKKKVAHAVKDLKVRFDAGQWPDSLTNDAYQNVASNLL